MTKVVFVINFDFVVVHERSQVKKNNQIYTQKKPQQVAFNP